MVSSFLRAVGTALILSDWRALHHTPFLFTCRCFKGQMISGGESFASRWQPLTSIYNNGNVEFLVSSDPKDFDGGDSVMVMPLNAKMVDSLLWNIVGRNLNYKNKTTKCRKCTPSKQHKIIMKIRVYYNSWVGQYIKQGVVKTHIYSTHIRSSVTTVPNIHL